MAEYMATVSWQRAGAVFTDSKYSRRHTWQFDGGAEVVASASPHVVKPQFCDPSGVDPEEAFVVALASCHMLWFLSIAAKRGYAVDEYRDAAVGIMSTNEAGRLAMTSVTLRPHVHFSGTHAPTRDIVDAMHVEAHDACFISNSVRTRVETIGSFDVSSS